MNANTLPFMRSLHNLARPHQFLRNNHPVGGAPHQPRAAGIMPSSAPAMPAAVPHASRTNAAGAMAPMAHGPRMHFADGGFVPSMDDLSNVDVSGAYPYDYDPGYADTSSDMATMQQLGNTPVGPSPSLLRSGESVNTPLSGTSDSYSNPDNADGTFTDTNPAANSTSHGFLGLSGKQWLKAGLGALQGVTGYASAPKFAGITSHNGAKQAQMAQSGYGPQQVIYQPAVAPAPGYAEGGRIPGNSLGRIPGYAQGGQVQAPQGPDPSMQAPNQNAKQLILAAAAVIAGQSNDQGAIQAFVQRFGQAELQHLVQVVKSGQLQLPQQAQPQSPAPAPQPQQNAMAMGGLVQGPGSGTSDSVPAVHAPTGNPISLSGGEYVVPASVVSAMGNGSTHAGAKKISAGIASVRRKKGMPAHSNPPDLSPNSNPLFDGR